MSGLNGWTVGRFHGVGEAVRLKASGMAISTVPEPRRLSSFGASSNAAVTLPTSAASAAWSRYLPPELSPDPNWCYSYSVAIWDLVHSPRRFTWA